MAAETAPSRPPLSRERILRAAIDLVDRDGLDALTMRRLGAELDVEAMSLYKHIANKDAILDGIIEIVVTGIEIPKAGVHWRDAMRTRALSARRVLSRHSWAIGLLEARGTRGPAVLRYLDTILGSLMSAGFSIEDAAHAFWLLDCYVYGQVVQETSMSLGDDEDGPATSSPPSDRFADFPNIAAMYDHARSFEFSLEGEFEFGLELILDGLDGFRSK